MKSIFFTLPLLAAMVSARAVTPSAAGLELPGQACATELAKCVERATPAREALSAEVVPRSLSLPPFLKFQGLPPFQNLQRRLSTLFERSLVETPMLMLTPWARRLPVTFPANGFDIGTLINEIINALDGKAGGIDIGAIVNKIIKAIGGIAGGAGVPPAGVDVGKITNIILGSMKHSRSAQGQIDIGQIVQLITKLLGNGGPYDLGKIINEIIHALNGKAGGLDVGAIVNQIIALIMSLNSGGLARRQEVPIDIGKLIQVIIGAIGSGNGGDIDIGKLIQTIIDLIPKGGR
ncbi:predicted protein [Uncinocarpus reesii 1704]|uniref:Uncharacterized protein n=1 Tax=Uncinocarpus reesii (strain UAMH 1704) TaxID=336963 RepID=C4JLT6_UNCRE|nr:uncharacterized protein UREG_03794 [Uncinocarpus reesii 1704]EEP78948.1 predicted protein [Uncinocarpus reesii 1704]